MVLESDSNHINGQQPPLLSRSSAYHHQPYHNHNGVANGGHHYHRVRTAPNGRLPNGTVPNGHLPQAMSNGAATLLGTGITTVTPPAAASEQTTPGSQQKQPQVNYGYLKKVCRDRGVLFEDPQFPPSNKALMGKRESPSLSSSSSSCINKIVSSIAWMRPYEICSRPKFICEGPTRFDVEQGEAIIAIIGKGPASKSSSSSTSSAGNCTSSNSSVSSSCATTNSSLLSAISCLTLTPKLLDRVVPPDQSFVGNNYSGIFRFRFWRFGEWIEVVIDDRLPTFKGRLLFLRSVDPTEFWAPLLEKAYAKLYGSYESYLRHCFTAQTLQDLTGGIAQSFTIPHHEGHIIYQMISSAAPRSTLLSVCISSAPPSEAGLTAAVTSSHPCSFSASSAGAFNKLHPIRLRNGLITRQSYSITGLARVRTNARPNGVPPVFNGNGHYHHSSYAPHQPYQPLSNHAHIGNSSLLPIPSNGSVEVILIRLRNAWGKGEWNGPWSERSWEWDHLSDRDKEELSLRCRDDGEFWMSFDDFLRFFSHLDLVHIGPDDWMQETTLHHKKPWRAVLARRRWRKGFNAGGAPTCKDTFATNPQFHVHIPKNGTNKCHVVVSVTQLYVTNPSESVNCSNTELQHIGFCVYEVPPGLKRLTAAFVANHRPLDVTAFTCTRETVTFFTLPPGDFAIVPSTEKPSSETKFLLRILTDEPSNIWEVNDDNLIFPDVSIPKVVENTGQNGHSLLSRLMAKLPNEIDAFTMLKVLKAYWKPLNILYDKPTLDLCRCLIMLKDTTITGKIVAKESLPSLLNMLHFWRTIFTKHQNNGHHKVSSYNLRLLLWESGISVSNKVLECLVIRFTNCSTHITLEAFLSALVKLHLSHDRYRSLERKGKNNSLTLEEMILLTTYS